MTSFRKPTTVLRRARGEHINGEYVVYDRVPEVILATIMPASGQDYSKIQETLGGRWPTELLRMYTKATLEIQGKDAAPGDRVEYKGEEWVALAESRRDVLSSALVSHNRYLLLSVRELGASA